ncbi:MAG: hypothetical protein AAFQ89_02650 [Cyanobacteria bacterium J06626_18]
MPAFPQLCLGYNGGIKLAIALLKRNGVQPENELLVGERRKDGSVAIASTPLPHLPFPLVSARKLSFESH